jgi:hypothetical protein
MTDPFFSGASRVGRLLRSVRASLANAGTWVVGVGVAGLWDCSVFLFRLTFISAAIVVAASWSSKGLTAPAATSTGAAGQTSCFYAASGEALIFHDGVMLREDDRDFAVLDQRHCMARQRTGAGVRIAVTNCGRDRRTCPQGTQHGLRCLYTITGEGVIYADRQFIQARDETFGAEWARTCRGLRRDLSRVAN